MGPNSKRNQAAAAQAAARNTPSRARFSKIPPGRGRGGGRGCRGGREDADKKDDDGDDQKKIKSRGIGGRGSLSGGSGRGNTETTARVINKIQNRITAHGVTSFSSSFPSTTTTASSSASGASSSSSNNNSNNSNADKLKYLDKSKLDIVAVSIETQNLISDLLRELGIVKNDNNNNNSIVIPSNNSEGNNISNSSTSSSRNNNNETNNNDTALDTTAAVDEVEQEKDDRALSSSTSSSSEESYIDYDQRMEEFLMEQQSDARNVGIGGGGKKKGVDDYDDDKEDEDEIEVDEELQEVLNRRKQQHGDEEEEDAQKEEQEKQSDDNDSENDNDNDKSDNDEGKEEDDNKDDDDNDTIIPVDNIINLDNDQTYIHLTQHLSFSNEQASKACHAIDGWQQETLLVNNAGEDDDDKDGIDGVDDDNRLELAMDWLCLHLSEQDINNGFLPNKNKDADNNNKTNSSIKKLSKSNIKIKAIAHPSISVISTPIKEQAKEWAREVIRQERSLKLMRLGFHRHDAMDMFEYIDTNIVSTPATPTTAAAPAASDCCNVLDDPALPLLLSQIQDINTASTNYSNNRNNKNLLQEAREEREQELEALQAIYDDRLNIVYSSSTSNTASNDRKDDDDDDKDGDDDNTSNKNSIDRYIVQLNPVTELRDPAKVEECYLHVFLGGRGRANRFLYPMKGQIPLLLFVSRPLLPPLLIRKIQIMLGKQANELMNNSIEHENDSEHPIPIIFDIIHYLEENLPLVHRTFCNEQRQKEFKANQIRLLKQRQIEIEKSEKTMELLNDINNKIKNSSNSGSSGSIGGASVAIAAGRRQRAKLKAAEKAYDRPDQMNHLNKEYRRKQDIRVKDAQHQAAHVRSTYAEQAIRRRQKEIVDEEAERCSRCALSCAIRVGKSITDARIDAEKARIESYRNSGVTILSGGGEDKIAFDNAKDDDDDDDDDDMQKKVTVEAVTIGENNKDNIPCSRPCPSAVEPTTDSAKYMESATTTTTTGTASSTSTATTNVNNCSNDDGAITVVAAAKISDNNSNRGPTPHTSAFMDRLREMYDKAAEEKKRKTSTTTSKNDDDEKKECSTTNNARRRPDSNNNNSNNDKLEGYHLEQSDDIDDDEDDYIYNGNGDEKKDRRSAPRPVAVPCGELVGVMKDILNQQKDQPWLISSEARAPTSTVIEGRRRTKNGMVLLSPAQIKREKGISYRLKNDLLRKRRAAKEWAESNYKNNSEDSNSSNKNGGRGQKQSSDGGGVERKNQRDNGIFTPKKFHTMMTVRQRLPASQMAHEVVETIDKNQITVIAGATGCGKTTQVPQLVLDDLIARGLGAATNIIITQPRRISAIGVAGRISEERCEKVGDTCGYSIKLEKKMSNKTRLLLCTTGVLLRRLQCDPDLASVSHIFVDEVHERDLNTDFLIIILKDLLARRKDLKLVLMSATLNADSFSGYFSGCPVVSIPGRAHPVTENRLEDILQLTGYVVEEDGDYAVKKNDKRPPKISKSSLRRLYHPKYSRETIQSLSIVNECKINYELLSELLEHISFNQGEGAILVFCPGFQEIQKTIEELYKKEYFQGGDVVIYPLHSSLSTEEQIAIFEVPPLGVRKIVVSTNIAETSITIEDVVFVVDTGRVKENRRDEVNETPTLIECWVSRASAKQRRGRAGRVRPGVAYHFYSSHTHDDEMLEYQLPEMLRVGIEDLVLQILILDLGQPVTFLKKALDPPTNLAMSNSLKLLVELGAVDCQWKTNRKIEEDENLDVTCELTALGFHLATLPVDPRVGKMMIYGALFGCVDPVLTLAAAMSSRSPFMSPFDLRDQADEARKAFAVAGSDHLTILNAFNQWFELRQKKGGNRVVQSFLKDNFLGRLTLFQIEDLRKQFHSLLIDIGFLPKKFQLKDMNHVNNTNSQNTGLIKAVLCAGLYPNIIVGPRAVAPSIAGGGKSKEKNNKNVGEHAFRSHTKGDVYLHPSTIAFDESQLDSRYCCYHELVRTSKIYVRDCTTVSPFALLLFGGKLEVFQTHGVCSVDEWLKFRIDAKPATLIKYLRGKMEQLLFQKIVSPQEDIIESEEGRALIQSISRLFESEYSLQIEQQEPAPPDSNGGIEMVRPWTGIDDENNRVSNRRRTNYQQEQNNINCNSPTITTTTSTSTNDQIGGVRGGKGRGGGGRKGDERSGRGRRGGR